METPYTLGLDIGNASVGAALLADDHIIALHVRAFDRAETAKEGKPLNQTRREKRLARRRLRRKRFRLVRLRRLLHREGLIDSPDQANFQGTDGPWTLRGDALDRKLSSKEWAATIYHIVKWRGFQSNRKSELAADKEVGQMLSGMTANQARMVDGGWRTV